eukprot:703863-Prymnesium_polylepis.2
MSAGILPPQGRVPETSDGIGDTIHVHTVVGRAARRPALSADLPPPAEYCSLSSRLFSTRSSDGACVPMQGDHHQAAVCVCHHRGEEARGEPLVEDRRASPGPVARVPCRRRACLR